MEPESESVSISTYFNDICRLCLKKGKLQMLENLEGDLAGTVFKFLEVLLDQKLPESICEQCFKELTQVALFIRKCKHSHSILQQIEEECAKIQASNHIQIEILEPEQADQIIEEVVCDTDFFYFNSIDIKTEPDLEYTSNYLRADEDHIASSEDEFSGDIVNGLNYENQNNQNNPNTDNVLANTSDVKICEKCGESVVKLKDHYKSSKSCQPKNIKCTECNMYFSKTESMKGHRIAHHWKETYPRFMCHICSKMFKYQVNLKRHIEVHETGKRFVCEICGKSYTTKIGLQDHVNLHTGEKPFNCSLCDKKFSMRSVRSLHQRKHLQAMLKDQIKREKCKDSAPAICDVCNKQFAHLRALTLHKLSHDENRVFTCHTCQLEFSSRMLLMRHYQTHNEKKLYECSYCKKSFKIRSYLATHMRTHTGERPYACTQCPKAFTQTAHLSYHMLLHKNEKSFVCQYCSKTFTLKGNLTVHLRIHTGERPYKCHVCDQGFRDSSGRKRHVISKHGRAQVAYIRIVDVNEM